MRKAARTVKPNARTGERHTWKDRERRRKEERQRMAAEALILEDAYQRGYTDAVVDMRQKKETAAAAGAGKESPPLVFH
jgi:hypothetical protein